MVRDVTYPKPEDYYFKPLNEHVPVFQRPFRMVQDLTVDASPQGQSALKDLTTLTIKGVLTYQACDDKVCFTPQSVPLTWTVTFSEPVTGVTTSNFSLATSNTGGTAPSITASVFVTIPRYSSR